MTFAICDDEKAETVYLSSLVKKWAVKRNVAAEIFEYSGAEELSFDSRDRRFDILLLDIQMGAMDGVALAKEIRGFDSEAQIIFVTGYMDYIADGYDVEALNYLIKPVSDEKLSAVLDRAAERLARNEKSLYINHDGSFVRVPLHEIRYLEVFHNYVTIHGNKIYKIKQTLGALEKELDLRFFRAGRSFIVNLRFVRKSTRTEIHMADGTIIPLSRGLYASLNRAIIENT